MGVARANNWFHSWELDFALPTPLPRCPVCGGFAFTGRWPLGEWSLPRSRECGQLDEKCPLVRPRDFGCQEGDLRVVSGAKTGSVAA